MVEPKAKAVVKKVTVPKTKATTAAADTKKVTGKAVATTPKKVVTKKKVVEVAEVKKTKAPAVKKVTATTEKDKELVKKAAATKVGVASKAVAAILPAKPASKPSPEERYRMIETAAYFIAEQHGFQGRSDAHWVAAERQIAAELGE